MPIRQSCLAVLVGLLGACTVSPNASLETRRLAMVQNQSEAKAAQSALLQQCERVVQGRPVDAAALTRQGFTHNTPGKTWGTYQKAYASFKSSANRDVPLIMKATFIDTTRDQELRAEGRRNPFGIGCTSSLMNAQDVAAFLVQRGYRLQPMGRGEDLVSKGNTQFIFARQRLTQSSGTSTSTIALKRLR